jgi:4-diphosphocytidyl-2-C-methyl-D-erythritol kinase
MITAHAFAKINLDLRIVGVQESGYHELRTTFQSIALHDVLTFAPTRGVFVVESDDPGCPVQGNIVERAAWSLWQADGRTGPPTGVRVQIEKRIPIAAGLGGGSADAAAALRALARLWRVRLTTRSMQEIAASLGADVPFFLQGGTARGRERGDVLSRMADRPRRWVVLGVPPFGVATKDAYGWFDEAAAATLKGSPYTAWRQGRRAFNDLQPPVVARHPEIGAMIEGLRVSGASHAAMSGSGSAVFGLFARRAGAEAAADTLIGRGRPSGTRIPASIAPGTCPEVSPSYTLSDCTAGSQPLLRRASSKLVVRSCQGGRYHWGVAKR